MNLIRRLAKSGLPQPGYNLFGGLPEARDLIDCPWQRRPQGSPVHRSTGFADGRQRMERPFLKTAPPRFAHDETSRQHDQANRPVWNESSGDSPEGHLFILVPHILRVFIATTFCGRWVVSTNLRIQARNTDSPQISGPKYFR
jgi:hypothetical protein